jgi:serine/threonine protein kinase
MGSVYAAHDTVKQRDIAIKVLLPELTTSGHARERFMAEGVVSCDLSHPNIVRVYDVGVSGEYLYFSMERLRGQTLRQRLKAQGAGRLPLATVTAIALQMIEALQYAQRFLVHRDIKPENIWVCEDNTVKLMDFGISHAWSNADLTRTGVRFGTPYYVAPEQWESAKHADWRADQYSLGVVLYELLTGTLPIGVTQPLDAVRRDIPRQYAQAVMRAMATKAEDRWPSWAALLAELSVPDPRQLRWAIGFGVLLAVIAALILYLKG